MATKHAKDSSAKFPLRARAPASRRHRAALTTMLALLAHEVKTSRYYATRAGQHY
ncbi:MAG: hypothetical protein WKG07_46995 [Hymenobacter sp.]